MVGCRGSAGRPCAVGGPEARRLTTRPPRRPSLLADIARQKCKDLVGNFAECAQANGLGVVLFCRTQLKEMNACLKSHTTKDILTEYKQMRLKELGESP